VSKGSSFIWLAALSVLAGAIGFVGGYGANNRAARELTLTLQEVVRIKTAELAYAFAPAAQVREMIQNEPPQRAEWAHTETKVKILRALRLAVVADSDAQRDALFKEAETLCEGCRPASLRKMFERYAQDRLVPPGNDIVCDDCGRKRKALPPLE